MSERDFLPSSGEPYPHDGDDGWVFRGFYDSWEDA